jgi:hypothetical protein
MRANVSPQEVVVHLGHKEDPATPRARVLFQLRQFLILAHGIIENTGLNGSRLYLKNLGGTATIE